MKLHIQENPTKGVSELEIYYAWKTCSSACMWPPISELITWIQECIDESSWISR